jgi:hypothetical protein
MVDPWTPVVVAIAQNTGRFPHEVIRMTPAEINALSHDPSDLRKRANWERMSPERRALARRLGAY